MRFASLVVAMVVVAGCTGAKEPPTETTPTSALKQLGRLDSLTWTGKDCAELALLFQVPVSNVRPYVHPNFTVFQTQGQATLAVGLARCNTAMVLANTTNNLVMSDVAVYVEDPDGGNSPVFYQFWHASNRLATVENMSRVGLPTQFAPNSNFITFGLVQATLIDSRIASQNGSYFGSGTSPSAPSPPATPAPTPPQTFRWWHASDNGTMYTDFTLALKTQSAATGNITATEGSQLAAMLGGTRATGEGLYWAFDLTATSTRV